MRREDTRQIAAPKIREMGEYREVVTRAETWGWNWLGEPVLRSENLNSN